jgi:hypothetical protein
MTFFAGDNAKGKLRLVSSSNEACIKGLNSAIPTFGLSSNTHANFIDLLSNMLDFNPIKRKHAFELIKHDIFKVFGGNYINSLIQSNGTISEIESVSREPSREMIDKVVNTSQTCCEIDFSDLDSCGKDTLKLKVLLKKVINDFHSRFSLLKDKSSKSLLNTTGFSSDSYANSSKVNMKNGTGIINRQPTSSTYILSTPLSSSANNKLPSLNTRTSTSVAPDHLSASVSKSLKSSFRNNVATRDINYRTRQDENEKDFEKEREKDDQSSSISGISSSNDHSDPSCGINYLMSHSLQRPSSRRNSINLVDEIYVPQETNVLENSANSYPPRSAALVVAKGQEVSDKLGSSEDFSVRLDRSIKNNNGYSISQQEGNVEKGFIVNSARSLRPDSRRDQADDDPTSRSRPMSSTFGSTSSSRSVNYEKFESLSKRDALKKIPDAPHLSSMLSEKQSPQHRLNHHQHHIAKEAMRFDSLNRALSSEKFGFGAKTSTTRKADKLLISGNNFCDDRFEDTKIGNALRSLTCTEETVGATDESVGVTDESVEN